MTTSHSNWHIFVKWVGWNMLKAPSRWLWRSSPVLVANNWLLSHVASPVGRWWGALSECHLAGLGSEMDYEVSARAIPTGGFKKACRLRRSDRKWFISPKLDSGKSVGPHRFVFWFGDSLDIVSTTCLFFFSLAPVFGVFGNRIDEKWKEHLQTPANRTEQSFYIVLFFCWGPPC